MTNTHKDGGGLCAWCEQPAHIQQGRILLCAVHYRISSMRSRARRDGKAVPTRHEIESMIPDPLVCIGCARPMNWLTSNGASSQISLQHDRSGTVRLICRGCNTRHSDHPGDTFYSLPADSKRCPSCCRVLPRGAFSIDRSRPVGLKSYCRPCSSTRHKQWRERHAVSQ